MRYGGRPVPCSSAPAPCGPSRTVRPGAGSCGSAWSPAVATSTPTSDLFTSGAGFLVMPEDGPATPVGAAGPVDVVRAGVGRVDVALALRRLDQVMDPPAFVQAEGGAHLNGALLAADCIDELDLTLSPVLVGGDGPRLTTGAPPAFERFELAHLATEDGYLYGRWTRRAP